MAAGNDKSGTDKFQKSLSRSASKKQPTVRDTNQKNSSRSTPYKKESLTEFAGQALELCDAYSEVQALNFFLYEVIEGLLESETSDSIHWPQTRQGLAVFLRWLRHREIEMKNSLGRHQAGLMKAESGK